MFQQSFVLLLMFVIVVRCDTSATNDLRLNTKLARIPLMQYQSYANVMLLHFYIPDDTVYASFKFKARDQPTSLFGKNCDARNVSVYIKPGSYPVINPDGIDFPDTFLMNLTQQSRQMHELRFRSDSNNTYINVTSPKPGDWFAATFLTWTDPKKDRIEQQGLTSKCESHLYSELSLITVSNITVLGSNANIPAIVYAQQNNIYKFYVPDHVDHVLISITITTPCKSCRNLTLYVQNTTIPNESNFMEELVIDARQEGIYRLDYWSLDNKWIYFNISLTNGLKSNKTGTKQFVQTVIFIKFIHGLDTNSISNTFQYKHKYKSALDKILITKERPLQFSLTYKQYNLIRLAAPDNFVFEYDFHPHPNGTTPLLLNVSSNRMSVLKFKVYDIIDIGGTLSLGLVIKPSNATNRNYTIIACIDTDVRLIPIYPDYCTFGQILTKAPIRLRSNESGLLDLKHIPYPDPGVYYLSIRLFPDDCVPCNCTRKCNDRFEKCLLDLELNCTENCDLDEMIEVCRSEIFGSDDNGDQCGTGCDCDGICEREQDGSELNASLIFSITSRPCIGGLCGSHGRCNEYIAGGFIFSSCQCNGGYKGWDCSNDRDAFTEAEILFALLLLTLSNLLFIPSIYFGYKRRYYTEALVYFLSMFSSTFYHACDSKEDQYGFCLFPIGVLQFCDFYCALLAIWVTLVAMAHTNTLIISICHVCGAAILAFGVTYNKYALWVYLLPTVCGFLIIGINWGLQCRRNKQMFPVHRYFKLYLPIGLCLVVMGIISFAFLETKENYKIVHSLWHMAMAVGLIFLLPSKKTFVPEK